MLYGWIDDLDMDYYERMLQVENLIWLKKILCRFKSEIYWEFYDTRSLNNEKEILHEAEL